MRTELEIKQLAKRLMRKHGLSVSKSDPEGWKLRLYMNTDKHLGQCCHFTRTIRLHRLGAGINTLEHLTDTILHEIAHALVGAGNGHGTIWQAKAVELGARPLPCVADDYVMPPKRPRLIKRWERIPADIPEIGGE